MDLVWRRMPIVGAVMAVAGLVLMASPLHLAGAVAVVLGVVILGLAAPDYGLLAILVLFPLHPLAARVIQADFGVAGTALLVFSTWKEMALAAVLAGQIGRLLAQHSSLRDVRLHFIDLVAAALVVIVAFGLVLHHGALALNETRLLLFPIGVYLAIRLSRLSVKRYFEAVAVVAIGIAAFLIFQSSLLGWDFITRYWGSAQNPVPFTFQASALIGPRGAGTFASPNEAALALAVWVCMLGAAVLVLKEWRRWRAVALGVVLVAVALTFSRTGIFGALAALTVVAVAVGWTAGFKPKQGLALFLVAVFAAVSVSGVIYSQRGGLELLKRTVVSLSASTDSENDPNAPIDTSIDTSTDIHLQSLGNALNVIASHPLGVGLGSVGARAVPLSGEKPDYIIESWYFTEGVSLGWLGLAWAFLVPIAFGAVAILAIRRGKGFVGYALLGTAVVVGCVSFLLPTMAQPQVAMIPWSVAGFAVGAGSLVADRRAGAPESPETSQ